MIALTALQMRLAGLVLAAVLLFTGGIGVGHHWASVKADAARTKAADKALADYQRGVEEGNAVATAVREQLAEKGRYMAKLEERLNRAPLITVSPTRTGHPAAACAVPGGGAADLSGHGLTAGSEPLAGQQPLDHPGDAGSADPVLSLAAVSLWNSALAGADVPAGACRSDDPTSAACAAGSGITLYEAWQNHAANAFACAADRARHQGLIDFITRRQQAQRP